MNRDFSNMAELLGYNETRVLLDIRRYSQVLLSMGDIFPPERDGVYDRITGDCLLDFGRGGGYWIDRRGNKHDIMNLEDFESANGLVYDFHNRRITSSVAALKRIQVVPERPLIFKAEEAAAAIVVDVLRNQHDFITQGRNIPDIDDAIYMDVIEDSDRRKGLYRKLEAMIHKDLSDLMNQYAWNDIWVSKSASVYMLDVKVDVRIREWYEATFKKRDSELEWIHENGQDHQNIRCT